MQIVWLKKEVEVTEGMKEALARKSQKLDRFTNAPNSEMKVSLKKTNARSKQPVFELKGFFYYNSQPVSVAVKDRDFYDAVESLVDKMVRRVRVIQTAESESRTRFLSGPQAQDTDEYREDEADIFAKRKAFAIKPMHEEEALLQMEILGHDFFLFQTEEGAMNLIYTRADGRYGLIETT